MPVTIGNRQEKPTAAPPPPPQQATAPAPPVGKGAQVAATEPRQPQTQPPIKAPTEPPQPALSNIGFQGGINEFNQRVQQAHDTFTKIHGYEPAPGLVLDIARSSVLPDQFSPLLQPASQSNLRNQAAIDAHYTPPPTAKDIASGVLKAAETNRFHSYIADNTDAIKELSKANQKDADTISAAVFKARRLSAFRDVETKLNSGDISPSLAHAQLQAMGFVPGGSAFKAAKGIGGLIATGIGQTVDSLVHSPAGMYELGKAVGLDTRDMVLRPDSGYRFAHTAPIAKGIVEGYKQDIEHPGQRPGFLFLDALGLLSAGAGGAARLGAAGRVLDETGSAAAAARQLGRRAPLTRAALRHGSIVEEMPLSQSPLVAAAQKVILERRQAGADARLAGETPSALHSILVLQVAQDLLDSQLSFETKLGREADARKRVDHIVATSLSRELDHVAGRAVMQARIQSVLPSKLRGALSRGEQKAIQVQSWDAVDPLQAERAFHQRMIEMDVGDPVAHRRQLADLKLAEKALANPSPRLVKALELTRQVVQQMEDVKINDLGLLPETAEGRVAKAGQVLRDDPIDPTHERVNPDSFYLPTQRRGKVKRPPSDRAGYFPVKAGPFGIPPGRDLPELTHEFTGKAIQAGDYRIDATTLASEAYGRTVRAASVRNEHAKLWKAASQTPYGAHSIPIRDVNEIPDKLREVVARLDEGDFGPKDAEVLPADMRDLLEHLYPDPRKLTDQEIEHVRWIDSRLLGEGGGMPHIPGGAARISQAVQAPFRFTTLYLRPAYILNKLGNHAMGLFDQGWLWPANFAKAMTAESRYGEEATRTIRELVGAGKSRSYVAAGSSGKISGAVAEFWNRVADRDERVAGFVYYMERKGYKTPEQVDGLLNDKANRADLVEIKRRADKSLVEFDNLLPIEKNYIRHLIFVYPWVSRSAVWSIRAALEHPVKTDALAHLGDQDLDTDPLFKHAPAWFRRVGYVPIGFNHDGSPKVVNPTSVNTFSTLGDFVAFAQASTVGDKYASAEDFLGPLPKYLVHAVTGRDEFGNTYPGSQWWDAAKAVLVGLPQVSAYQRAGKAKRGSGKLPNVANRSSLESALNANLHATVMSPGWLSGYGSLLAGGFSPRDVNMPALTARYWSDQDPATRHVRELDLLNRALDIQGSVLKETVPKSVRAAVADQANLDFQYKAFLKKSGRVPTDKERAGFTISYLAKQGLLPSSTATDWRKKLAPLADVSDINRLKNLLLDRYANGKALRQWDTDIRTVASFSQPVFAQKVRELHAQGLVDQNAYTASQDQLYDYGRKYLAFTREVRKLHQTGASSADLRAFQDQHDVPVNGLPSFVRISWANQTPQAQAQALQSATVRSWHDNTAFDKALLGRPSSAKVTTGWAKLNEIVSEQRAALKREGRSFPAGYERTLAKYVERYYDAPGLVRDYDFAKQPLNQRLKYLTPIQQSPNKTLWLQLLDTAATYSKWLHAKNADGAHVYSVLQVKQSWEDYAHGSLQAWIGQHPSFKRELGGYGKTFLSSLVG